MSPAEGAVDEPHQPGWELYFPVQASDREVVIRKTRDDGFDGTPLAEMLSQHGVKRISIGGVMSEMCVAATARTALARGLGVVMPHDGHATYNIGAASGISDEVPAPWPHVSRSGRWAMRSRSSHTPLTSPSQPRAEPAIDGCNHGQMSRDELRRTFDAAASAYQSARPAYPDNLYRDLLAITGVMAPAHLLEVGCGPGKATLPLARMGFQIRAIELGEALAAEARRNLAEFPDVSVDVAPFETWRPSTPHSFDLVYAATSWHWVDPKVRYTKAAEALVPGGHLAVWGASHGLPEGFDPFFTEIQDVYTEIGENHEGDWPPPPPEAEPDYSAEFDSSGLFRAVAVRRYVWERRYTADSYLALLNTFSGHIAMAPAKREHLYREIRRRLALRPDGELTRHWVSVLTVGQRV